MLVDRKESRKSKKKKHTWSRGSYASRAPFVMNPDPIPCRRVVVVVEPVVVVAALLSLPLLSLSLVVDVENYSSKFGMPALMWSHAPSNSHIRRFNFITLLILCHVTSQFLFTVHSATTTQTGRYVFFGIILFANIYSFLGCITMNDGASWRD